MPDLGRSQPIQSHTSTPQWRTFETRMRQRRAERCLIRADVALEAGVLDDAEASIEEARRLDGNVPGLDALARRLAEARSTRAARPARRAYAASAAVVLMAAGVGGMMWRGAGEPAAVEPSASTVAVAPASRPAVNIVERFVTAPVTTPTEPTEPTEPAAAEDESPPPPRPRQSAATETAPAAETPARAADPPPPPVVTARAPEPSTAAPPPAAPAAAAPVPIDPVAAPRDLRTADARTSPPPPPAAEPARVTRDEPVVDEVARVRAVLSRYEAAYSGLDAAAARAVWPAVDERALSRAFNGLQSQRVSLERCDVSVSGASARAECAGRATWVPKVGGSGRTETRRWLFDLRQASGGWQIVSAEAR